MPKKNTERPKEKIVLEYYEDDMCKVFRYQRFIKKHIKLKNKIPARVLKSYFDLFDKTLLESNHIKTSLVNNARIRVLSDLNTYGQGFSFPTQYEISIHDKNKKTRRRKKDENAPDSMMNSVWKMLDKNENTTLTSTIFINKYYDNLITKNDFYPIVESKAALLKDAKKFLLAYIDPAFNRKIEGFPSKYNQTIIVALILASFGLLLTKHDWEKSGSNYTLYHAYLNKAVDYHCNK